MKIFKSGLKMWGSIIVAAVISFFLCISMNIICSALFTYETGYKAFVYETETSEKSIAEYDYAYTDKDGDGKDDGTDTKKEEYEDEGYTVITVKQRSTLTGAGKTVFLVSTQVLSLIMVIAFASNASYKQGFKDSNLVKIGHTKNDTLKGFKIGFIGNIPFLAIFVMAVVMSVGLAPDFRTVWYAFLNSHYYSAVMWITGNASTLSQLGILQYVLLFLLQLIVPVISGVAYILGLKEISLSEKIVYKKEVN
ncbi:MAG: hypothetical protein IJY79_02380 [Clostridia bacterium]|nr:hypothetical protein [Clostridia bacterium]